MTEECLEGESPDVREIAVQYLDHLKSETAKVEAFLAMADDLSNTSEHFDRELDFLLDVTVPERLHS